MCCDIVTCSIVVGVLSIARYGYSFLGIWLLDCGCVCVCVCVCVWLVNGDLGFSIGVVVTGGDWLLRAMMN